MRNSSSASIRPDSESSEGLHVSDADRVAHWISQDPAFSVLTIKGDQWIDPHTGTLVDAVFDWQQAATDWLLTHKPWNKHSLHSLTEILELRWRYYLRENITENPQLRRFDQQGRWLNPYTGQWETGVTRNNQRVDANTLRDIARILAINPDIQSATMLDDATIERVLQSQGTQTNKIKQVTPLPVIKAEESSITEPSTEESKKSLYAAPAAGIQRKKINTKRIKKRESRNKVAGSSLVSGYQVMARLGSGGMSTVYRAHHLRSGRDVALKILKASGEKTETFAERFMREAKAASSITDPHVTQVYDFGQSGDTMFMSMELMEGGDAELKMIERGKPLSEREALAIIRDATAGLVAIHTHGAIHRDIKPSNIFLTKNGKAKLGDLGLAKHSNADFTVTVEGAAVGTPAFMAPEQARGTNELSPAVDTYAIGATLYSLLAGRPPYTGPNVYSIVRQVVADPFPDVREHNRAVRPITAALIAQATSKNPADRFTDSKTMLAAIEIALRDCPEIDSEPTQEGIQAATVRDAITVAGDAPQHGHQESVILNQLGWVMNRHHATLDDRDVVVARSWADGYLVICATADKDSSGNKLSSVIDDALDSLDPLNNGSPAQIMNVIEEACLDGDHEPPSWISIMLCEGDGISISVSGGHKPLLFATSNELKINELGFNDPALGESHDVRREQWLQLNCKDLVVIASAGAHKALDISKQPLTNRLLAMWLLMRDDHTQPVSHWLGGHLSRFSNGALEHDATFVVIERLPERGDEQAPPSST